MIIHIRRLAALALTLVVAGCSAERASAPPPVSASASAPSGDLLGGLVGTVGAATSTLQLTPVIGLRRTTPLATPITVAKTIGSEGGSLSIPEAGVTVTVPSGALVAPTVITMTARAGSLVAYDFEPHGITFARRLVFSQSLRGTNATLLNFGSLKLGYYSDPSLLTPLGGLVSELLDGSVDLLAWRFQSNIPHFSGYILSCGNSE